MSFAVASTFSNEANRIIKVNHAGEFGAINIYRAQILVGRLLRRKHVSQLEELIEHEKSHLAIFEKLLASRGVARCRSFWLCGLGGFLLGALTALLGQRGVMACTAAVENVVLGHLQRQMAFLEDRDPEAYSAVASIVADEEEHRDVGETEGGDNPWYRPVRFAVAMSTEFVIWLGMKL